MSDIASVNNTKSANLATSGRNDSASLSHMGEDFLSLLTSQISRSSSNNNSALIGVFSHMQENFMKNNEVLHQSKKLAAMEGGYVQKKNFEKREFDDDSFSKKLDDHDKDYNLDSFNAEQLEANKIKTSEDINASQVLKLSDDLNKLATVKNSAEIKTTENKINNTNSLEHEDNSNLSLNELAQKANVYDVKVSSKEILSKQSLNDINAQASFDKANTTNNSGWQNSFKTQSADVLSVNESLEILRQGMNQNIANSQALSAVPADANRTSANFASLGNGVNSKIDANLSSGSNYATMFAQAQKTLSKNSFSKTENAPDLLKLSQNLKENAEAITQKVMSMASKNLKTVDLSLNPEHLGSMKISIAAVEGEDNAKITIAASNPATKEILEQGLSSLRESLKQVNIDANTEIVDYLNDNPDNAQQGFSQGNGSFEDDKTYKQSKEQSFLAKEDDEDTLSNEDKSVILDDKEGLNLFA